VVEARHLRDDLVGRADDVPFILPSTVDPNSSLTVWDASSSHLTLFVMLVVTVIFMPLILAYTAWVYKVLWGKVTEADVTEQLRHRLLRKETHHVVFRLASRPAARRPLRRRQRHVG
jgi:hypothetical protein